MDPMFSRSVVKSHRMSNWPTSFSEKGYEVRLQPEPHPQMLPHVRRWFAEATISSGTICLEAYIHRFELLQFSSIVIIRGGVRGGGVPLFHEHRHNLI